MGLKHFTVGLCCGILLLSCASASTFGFKAYVLDYNNRMLRAPKGQESKDLKEEICIPTAGTNDNCYVFLKSEFYRLRQEVIDLKDKVRSYEKTCSK